MCSSCSRKIFLFLEDREPISIVCRNEVSSAGIAKTLRIGTRWSKEEQSPDDRKV